MATDIEVFSGGQGANYLTDDYGRLVLVCV
jgi:hypothetical protein